MRRRTIGLAAAAIGVVTAVAWPAYAYLGASATPATTATALTLAAPSADYISTTDSVTWHLAAAPANPNATRYTVYRGGTKVCQVDHLGGGCPADPVDTGPASAVTYVLAGELGTAWTTSQTVQAYTKPPAPRVSLTYGSDSGVKGDNTTNLPAPKLSLNAPAGASDYTVQLFQRSLPDGASTALLDPPVTIKAGTAKTIIKTVSLASDGDYAFSAVASFHGQDTTSTKTVVHRVSGAAHVTSFSVNNGGTSGLADDGDQVRLTYDRPITPTSICEGWGQSSGTAYTLDQAVTVTTQADSWAGNGGAPLTDSLTATPSTGACDGVGPNSINLGKVYLYSVTGGCTFTDSTLAISSDWRHVTLTLGGQSADPCLHVSAGMNHVGFQSSAPSPFDYAGNAVSAEPLVVPEFDF